MDIKNILSYFVKKPALANYRHHSWQPIAGYTGAVKIAYTGYLSKVGVN